jgi:hypothetical protein
MHGDILHCQRQSPACIAGRVRGGVTAACYKKRDVTEILSCYSRRTTLNCISDTMRRTHHLEPGPDESEIPVPAIVTTSGEFAVAEYRQFLFDRRRTHDTRAQYRMASQMFLIWCEQQGLTTLTAVQPNHVLGWFVHRCQQVSALTAIGQTGCVRRLFDQFVHWRIVPANPVPSAGRLRLFFVSAERNRGA